MYGTAGMKTKLGTINCSKETTFGYYFHVEDRKEGSGGVV